MLDKLIKRIKLKNIDFVQEEYSRSGVVENKDPNFYLDIEKIKTLPGEELKLLNDLLPWASYVLDDQGRQFGSPYSSQKRNEPQPIPDARIIELHNRYDLDKKKVLEAGCFEGIHTVALCQFGAEVSAFDGRIENVIKTLVRCWAFSVRPDVFFWNLEVPSPAGKNIECDILHHVGVLYHLKNPLEHLKDLLPKVGQALILDTHIAPENNIKIATCGDFEYRYFEFKEGGRTEPFAGLESYAKWIYLEDLMSFLTLNGFEIDKHEVRKERNGPRVLLYAHR